MFLIPEIIMIDYKVYGSEIRWFSWQLSPICQSLWTSSSTITFFAFLAGLFSLTFLLISWFTKLKFLSHAFELQVKLSTLGQTTLIFLFLLKLN